MEWLIETLTDVFSKIRFSRTLNSSDMQFRQWCIQNIETKPDLGYKNLTFDLCINFGNEKTFKELYTPDFVRNLESKIASVSEKIENTRDYMLIKTMTVTIKRY